MEKPTAYEIEQQIAAAEENDYPGMTYAEGVKAALEWVLGDTEETPFEE